MLKRLRRGETLLHPRSDRAVLASGTLADTKQAVKPDDWTPATALHFAEKGMVARAVG